jgi:hypothetical protein
MNHLGYACCICMCRWNDATNNWKIEIKLDHVKDSFLTDHRCQYLADLPVSVVSFISSLLECMRST